MGADEIGDAAAKLSKAAYPFMKEVPWNSNLYNLNPGSTDAVSWAKAIGKMGSVSALVDSQVPAYLMSTWEEADAKAAYAALVDFAGVVKAHPITASTPASTVSGGSISSAAGKLSAAAYPLIKDVDWTSNLFSKPIPGKSPQEVMKAVDKMIVMGSAMDGAALKEAAQAHVKAIEGVDAKGVLSQADFEAINAGLGKAIASVPTSKVMDVYNAMAGVVGSSPVPNYLYSQVNPQDAQAAYNALLQFKDVVAQEQR